MQDYNSTPPILSSLTVLLLIAPTHYILIRQCESVKGMVMAWADSSPWDLRFKPVESQFLWDVHARTAFLSIPLKFHDISTVG
ncbi:hypothetical protein [Absidia glauca]|uniref:Uncharacterized protein n=1 Tax=Absidia glauca TaxID=4829 RepID=A0A168LIS8_ABSGL|nr:hypothetical protein [Absidia glauca]